jgi:hypothetical protein
MKNTKIKNVLAIPLLSNGKSGTNGLAEINLEAMPNLSTSSSTTGQLDINERIKQLYSGKNTNAEIAALSTAAQKNSLSSSVFSDMMKGNSGNYIGLDTKPWKPVFGADGTISNLDQLDLSASGAATKNNMGFMDKYGAGITTGLSALNAGVGILAYGDSHTQLKDNLKSSALNRQAVQKDMDNTQAYMDAYKVQ